MAPPLRQVTLNVTLKVGVALKKHMVMFIIIYVSVGSQIDTDNPVLQSLHDVCLHDSCTHRSGPVRSECFTIRCANLFVSEASKFLWTSQASVSAVRCSRWLLSLRLLLPSVRQLVCQDVVQIDCVRIIDLRTSQ